MKSLVTNATIEYNLHRYIMDNESVITIIDIIDHVKRNRLVSKMKEAKYCEMNYLNLGSLTLLYYYFIIYILFI